MENAELINEIDAEIAAHPEATHVEIFGFKFPIRRKEVVIQAV